MIITKIVQNFNENNTNYAAGVYGFPNSCADTVNRWKAEGKAVDASDEEKTAYSGNSAPEGESEGEALYDF